jgi:hypothetical protein
VSTDGWEITQSPSRPAKHKARAGGVTLIDRRATLAVLGVVVAVNLPALVPIARVSTPIIGAADKTPGSVWAWGDYNVFGHGSAALVLAHGLSDVVEVAVSGGGGSADTGYALNKNGTVLAWGAGSSGQLGNGATTDSVVPVEVRRPL